MAHAHSINMTAERKSGWTDNSEEKNHESAINMKGGVGVGKLKTQRSK